ncbi:MAG: tetratricopeptide repeat protein [Smithella sp.]|nr:tetratricopeptide repeat protein [Smithella sp.]
MKSKHVYFVVIFLVVVSCAAFGRIAFNDFINFDDLHYITENRHIQSGFNLQNIKWAFSSFEYYYWQPLTWLSHTLDWSLFKDYAGGHHLMSLLLHIGSVLLLFFFLFRTTGNLSSAAFVAAFFALHPLRVESIAWAAERKDVLSMFFGLASIYAYACYAEHARLSRYFLCLILFALSLMSKPTFVTLPFALLLLDYWPLGRWQKALSAVKEPQAVSDSETKRNNKKPKAATVGKKATSAPLKSRMPGIAFLVYEKIPFLLLTIFSSIVTFWGQNKFGIVVSLESMSLPLRFQNAAVAYVAYLGKLFWPVDLAIFYPYEYFFPFWQVLASYIVLIGITVTVIYTMKKTPFLFVGWFWYLGTLVPVIGLVQVATQSMADRWTYLPSIGIGIMLSWGIPLLVKSENIRKKIIFPAGVSVLIILAILTWHQCGYWKNSLELFGRALQITKDNVQASINYGMALAEDNRLEEAIVYYNDSIRISPDYLAYQHRGNAYMKLGRYAPAIEDYNEAIRIKPNQIVSYNKRGAAYYHLGDYQLAIRDYSEAIRLKPHHAEAYGNRGTVYHHVGQYLTAVKDYDAAIRLNPDYAEAYNNRGITYHHLGRFASAIQDYDEAIRLKPDYAEAYGNRGNAYLGLGRFDSAIQNYDEAIRLKPDHAEMLNNRGAAYLIQGNAKSGCRDARKACELGKCRILEMARQKGDCR